MSKKKKNLIMYPDFQNSHRFAYSEDKHRLLDGWLTCCTASQALWVRRWTFTPCPHLHVLHPCRHQHYWLNTSWGLRQLSAGRWGPELTELPFHNTALVSAWKPFVPPLRLKNKVNIKIQTRHLESSLSFAPQHLFHLQWSMYVPFQFWLLSKIAWGDC